MQLQRTAWTLSVTGLLPFAILTVTLFALPLDSAMRPLCVGGLKTYGAVVLSFLGGVRWGVVLSQRGEHKPGAALALSVLPTIIGWSSLYLPTPYVFAVLTLAFAAQGALDSFAGESGMFAPWFVRLRVVLTFFVAGFLIAAFFATV